MAAYKSDVLFNTDYSITFQSGNTTVNTWTKWRLIPTVKPSFTQPNPVYKFVDVPGMDGQLDMTDYLIGRPTYSNRQGTFEFYLAKGYTRSNGTVNVDSKLVQKELAAFFKGESMLAVLGYDLDYMYYGRFMYKGMTSESKLTRFTIEYQVDPYKYDINTGEEAGL